jgi:hypothetical protein
MATCAHADRVIPLLHDNELQNPLRREIVAHITTCVTCARTFSVLEREQELLTQVVEERIDSIDFTNFWQVVETRLSDPPLSWAARLRLWYESWRPTWAFPRPAWAFAALMLLSFGFTHLYLNGTLLNTLIPPIASGPKTPDTFSPPLDPELSPNVREAGHEQSPEPSSLPQFDIPDNDNRAQIESFCTYGSGAVAINIYYDYESNATVISCGSSTSEYPQ